MWLKKLYSIIILIIYPIHYKNIPVPRSTLREKERKSKKIVWELKEHERKVNRDFDKDSNNHNTEIHRVRSNGMMSRLSTHHF